MTQKMTPDCTAAIRTLARSDDLQLRASALRVLKGAAGLDLEELRKAAAMRTLAADAEIPADVRSLAKRWLADHGHPVAAPAISRQAEKAATAIIGVARRGRAEGWTRDRLAAEIDKAYRAAFTRRRT